jgi:large subunit ribosomal protein L16
MKGLASGHLVTFGEYGLKATSCAWVTSHQLEAARKCITHATKRNGRLWIRIFPDKPITQKGAGAPLGAGKGDVKGYVAVVRPGRIIFEVAGLPSAAATQALRLAAAKLPLKTTILAKK